MLLKLTLYDLDVRYVLGKQEVISDCLSRASVSAINDEFYDEIGVNLVDCLGMEDSALSIFRDATSVDDTSRVVMDYVAKGWPGQKVQVDKIAREYWSYREELSVEDGILFRADRLVVPRVLRNEMLNGIHGAHLGESTSLILESLRVAN